MEYYSSIKRQEILTPTTMWMNLADMMLSEISQSQKDKYSDCVHVRDLKQSDSQRQTVDGGCQGLGKMDRELVFNGQSFSLGDENIPEMDGGDGCTMM